MRSLGEALVHSLKWYVVYFIKISPWTLVEIAPLEVTINFAEIRQCIQEWTK